MQILLGGINKLPYGLKKSGNPRKWQENNSNNNNNNNSCK